MNKKTIAASVLAITLGGTMLAVGIGTSYNEKAQVKVVTASEKAVKTYSNTEQDKTLIQNKMLNSIDNFKTVSGTMEYFSTLGDFNLLVEYQADVSDQAKSYEKVQVIEKKGQNRSAVEVEDAHEIRTFDGDTITTYNSGSPNPSKSLLASGTQPSTSELEVPEMSEDQKNLFKGTNMEQRVGKMDGENVFHYRLDPANMGVSKSSLFPQEIAMGFLRDNSMWEIVGEESVAGVNTVFIKGELNDNYQEKFNAKDFTLNVHPDSGILVELEVRDSEGTLKESLHTKTIEIDKTIDTKLFSANNNK